MGCATRWGCISQTAMRGQSSTTNAGHHLPLYYKGGKNVIKRLFKNSRRRSRQLVILLIAWREFESWYDVHYRDIRSGEMTKRGCMELYEWYCKTKYALKEVD